MGDISSKEGNFDSDIEKGILSSIEVPIFEPVGMKPLYSEPLISTLGGSDELVKVEEGEVLSVISSCGDDIGSVKLSVVVDDTKKEVKEKPKVAKSAKKPPRPPRGVSLDSSDHKLIRDLHELAKFKRARIERMKALKKAKEAKASSSKNHLFATLLTVLFGLVLLFQGISSRSNSRSNFHASPIPSGETQGGAISIQQRPFPPTSGVAPDRKFLRPVERVSGFDTRDKVNSVVG